MRASFQDFRVAVLGNCQSAGLTEAAKHLLPGAEVAAWHVGVNPRDTEEEILSKLPKFDLVISQVSNWPGRASLDIIRLRDSGFPVVYVPVMAFQGFHPDVTYIVRPNGSIVPGALSEYHSQIAVAAFLLGLSADRAISLFNSYVFARFGYFDVFDAGRAALFDSGRRDGFDLAPLFDLWLKREGQFMYTTNHPHVGVLASLCRTALIGADVIGPETELPDGIDDALSRQFTWPVYPPIAKHIGIVGSTTFRRAATGPEDHARDVSLADYVGASYEAYQALGPDAIRFGNATTACMRLAEVLT